MMTQKKFEMFFIDEYSRRAIIIGRIFDIFCALATSGTIAAWAIWQKFPIIWLIVASIAAVVSIIRPFLPYEGRLNELGKMEALLANIFTKIKEKWFEVSGTEMTDLEINRVISAFEADWVGVTSKYLKKDFLPERKKIMAVANHKNLEYFERNI